MAAEPHLQVSFALRRRYDVTNSIHLGGSLTPRGYGGSLAYLRHFGPKRTLNSRFWYAGPTVSVSRYQQVEEAGPEIPDEMLVGATMGSVGLLLGRDDREYFWDPRTGSAFSLGAGYSGGRDDDGRGIHVGSLGARAFGLWSPGFGHTFALYGGVTGLVGEPVAADLASLSDRQLLRGFAIDETYGRLGLYAVAEYRHALVDLSSISLLVTRLDRLQGALFVAGGTMSWPRGYSGLFTTERLYTEVGYGIRLHMLSLGVAQYMIALDLAWPITPRERTYEVTQADGTVEQASRPPFKLVFGITQTY